MKDNAAIAQNLIFDLEETLKEVESGKLLTQSEQIELLKMLLSDISIMNDNQQEIASIVRKLNSFV